MTKLCVVIGGSQGLGKALCRVYRENNYQVAEFSRSGVGDDHHELDLSRREVAIDNLDQYLATMATDPWDEVHLLVNAAMLAPIGPLYASEPKQWWQHIDVNITLPISIVGRFQWHFKAHSARKVVGYVSSGAATTAFDGWSLYGASKAGLEQFIRCMALEQARLVQPILCAILDPGVMDTQMQASIRDTDPSLFSQQNVFVERHKSGGLVDPSLVAANIFKSLVNSFENGAQLHVSAS